MNSNVDAYLSGIIKANTHGLEEGSISIANSLPCLVCRELEAPSNRFVDSSDPFLMSYRALRRIQRIVRPVVPRKIEFGSAVYLKEGVIDCIFPDSPVTLLFVGDGNSDKRFAYNCRRLFSTFRQPFNSYCFIYNSDLTGTTFGRQRVNLGWDDDQFFFHASSWAELEIFKDLISHKHSDGRVISIIDLDGTLLCPRPAHSSKIKAVRREAIVSLCDRLFNAGVFSMSSADQVTRLVKCYEAASATGFSKSYDDEDLTMLIALGLYAGVIVDDDVLLNPANNVGFVTPIEWLQYAAFLLMGNDASAEYALRQLRSLYVRCTDAIQSGAPSSFPDFRVEEERALIAGAKSGEIVLNRSVVEFIRDIATLNAGANWVF